MNGCQLGLGALVKRANGLSPGMKILVQKFVPFPAVGAFCGLSYGFVLQCH